MEKKGGLKVVTQNQYDFMRVSENSVQFGTPVLLQDVGEELDPGNTKYSLLRCI